MLFPDVVSDTQLIDRSQSEFIFAPRCDNLFSTYAAMEGIIASTDATGPSDGRVSMVACFDNEEVGSVSAYGAESNFIESCIERVAIALKLDGESEAEADQGREIDGRRRASRTGKKVRKGRGRGPVQRSGSNEDTRAGGKEKRWPGSR